MAYRVPLVISSTLILMHGSQLMNLVYNRISGGGLRQLIIVVAVTNK